MPLGHQRMMVAEVSIVTILTSFLERAQARDMEGLNVR